MKKKLIPITLSCSLALALFSPGLNLVKAEEITPVLTEEQPTQLLVESENLVIYQVLEADGFTYEYHEEIITDGEIQDVVITKYKVIDGEKVLVEESEQTIETTENGDILVTSDQTEEPVLIEITDIQETPEVPTGTVDVLPPPTTVTKSGINYASSLRYQTGSGGSYIADTRWITYSDGSATAIMNGQSPYYKYTKTGNDNFKIFKIYANDLKKKELELTVIGGALSVADALIDAIKSGKILSWTLLKTVSSKVLKSIPAVGTLYALWDYAGTYLDARTYYRRI
ncbi:hypothetical protein [Robertmurraya sp. FSL R5-0851]|uniref:hypothetical protein n=1 Tax=Robertmurraya sp. FSL R5-0851 TaxID=2921584 RepID=UPI0030F97DCE